METKSLVSLMFLFQGIMNGVNLAIAQKPTSTQQFARCSTNGDFKSDALLKERDDAFNLLYKSFGQPGYCGHDTGNGVGMFTTALCPPNIKMEACRECISNTVPYLKKNCPKQKEGVAWTVLPKINCIVRYSDSPIGGKLADWANWAIFASPANQATTNPSDLEKGLNNLANKLKDTAAGGDNLRKFAHGTVVYGPGRTLYGYMQCTPDIEKGNCLKCLSGAITAIHDCCSKQRKLTGQALSTNCYFWYAHHDFFPK